MKTESLLRDEKEADTSRKSGIEVVGDIPWGTHLCQFYETKEDLIDILVPYFAVGLRNNEFCMWVTSPPLGVEEARAALQKAVPNLEQYIKKGQIEILPHTDWYLLGGEFDADRVLEGWVEKEKGALDQGFAGLRLTGNTFWIERNRWKSFADYEATVNDVIGEHRMIAICSYSLKKCTGSDVVDVIRNHQSALIKRGKTWILAEDVLKRRLLEKKVAESQMRLKNIFDATPDAITVCDLNGNIIECNQATLDMQGASSKEELIGKSGFAYIAKKDRQRVMEDLKKALERGSVKNIEYTLLTRDGREFVGEQSVSVIKDSSGNPIGLIAITKDITERKKAEEELIRLSSAVKMSTDSIVISDMDAKIIDVNEATLKMYGTNDKRDLIGKNSFDLIAPEEQEKAFAGMKKVLEKGYIKRREYNIITKDGGRIPVEMSVAIMKDAGGEPIGFVGISRDITERKKAEEELIKSEMRYRSLVEDAGAGIVTTDWRGRCTFANKELCKMMGYSEKELMGKHFADFLHPDDKKRILQLFWKAFRRPKRELYLEFRVNHKKGHVVHMYSNPTLFRYKNKIVGFNAIISDITERKRAEKELRQYREHLEELVKRRTAKLRRTSKQLRESEERLRSIVENTPNNIMIVDRNGIIQYANWVVGYLTVDEVIGKSIFDYLPQNFQEGSRQALDTVFKRGIPDKFEVSTIHDYHWISHFVPIYLRDGEVTSAMIISVDITERKRMEQQLLKAERLATIGEVATMVGHDLRNPLQAIENATYYLNNELSSLFPSTPIPQKTIEMLQVLNNSVNYADKVIRDLQDFASTKKPMLKKTDINAIVKEVLSQVEAPEKVELIIELGNLPKIEADKDAIKRAFLNLAINGIQAMKEEGGTLKVSTKKTKGFVEVSFKDTGIGITKENMEKIFAPFFTTRAKGMGMGLPICKKFVEGHGGSVTVESEEGKGSTFTVKLPIK